jgi:hypothetical protein
MGAEPLLSKVRLDLLFKMNYYYIYKYDILFTKGYCVLNC